MLFASDTHQRKRECPGDRLFADRRLERSLDVIRQGGVEVVGDGDLTSGAARLPGSCRLIIYGAQTGHRPTGPRDDDFFSVHHPSDQSGQVRFRGVAIGLGRLVSGKYALRYGKLFTAVIQTSHSDQLCAYSG